MHSQNAIDAADSQTLSEESKFRLRTLSCIARRELVRDELSKSARSEMPPEVTVETLAMFRTSPILTEEVLHPGRSRGR